VEQHQLISEKEDGKYWQQVSRWVKYEEGMEKAGDRWGKAHIPALNFHSLVNLRRLMEAGLILLDLDVPDMESLASAITDTMKEIDMLGPSDLVILKKTLLLKHRHVEEEDSERAWSHLEKEMNREVEGSAVEVLEVSQALKPFLQCHSDSVDLNLIFYLDGHAGWLHGVSEGDR